MTSYLHPVNCWRVGAGDARNGRGPDEPPPGYRWRDPRRVSPERLAQLEAHDRAYPDKISNPRRDAKLEYALRTALRDPLIARIMNGEDS